MRRVKGKDGEFWQGDDLRLLKSIQFWRYVKALEYIAPTHSVLDYGCGCGYGCYIMSHKAKSIVGYDKNSEAIEKAKIHWAAANVEYVEEEPNCAFDVITLFEVLEHIEGDVEFLHHLLKKYFASLLLITMPHVSHPLDEWHYEHYTDETLSVLLRKAGWKVLESKVVEQKLRPVVWAIALSS